MEGKNLLSLHEAIVVALINQPSRTATFEEIASFIEKRDLYTERKGNISLAKQVMLRVTKSQSAYQHLFEELGKGYIRLRDSYADFPLQLASAFEAILEPYKPFFEPPLRKIAVVDPDWGENRKVLFNVRDVICIFSNGEGRKKSIYTFEISVNGARKIKKFTKQVKLEKLVMEIDKLSHHLAVISKDAAVNVAYFSYAGQNKLLTNLDDPVCKEWPDFGFSGGKKSKVYFRNFNLIQDHYNDLNLLQKKVLCYKQDFSL